MSHALGALKFKDGTIKYYEYDGTSDVVLSHFYDTPEEVSDNWRKGTWINCGCGNEESVMIFSSYGAGYYIEGKACKNCKSVTSNDVDFDMIESDNTDHWAKEIDGFNEY